MKITTYIFRALLAYIFISAGFEKLFLPYDPVIFKSELNMAHPVFFDFYNLLQKTNYLYFVGFFQLFCGLLTVFKRTSLLAAVMIVPLMLAMLMTHVFISRYWLYIFVDSVIMCLPIVIIAQQFKPLIAVFLKKQTTWI